MTITSASTEESAMEMDRRDFVLGATAGLIGAGGEILPTLAQAAGSTAPRPAATPAAGSVDPRHVDRLRKVMVPLLQHMNHPLPLSRVRVGVLSDSRINAANGGAGEFYVTSGLLQRATDDQLRAVMGHETAHADLGHVAKLKRLGAGLELGTILLEQIFPRAQPLAPIAAQLVTNAYTRREEYAADRHGVELLRRAGYDGKALMVRTLAWLKQTEGESGGFFATHPTTGDRIQAVQQMP
jgi:Zn-dependent protease with chaperone function